MIYPQIGQRQFSLIKVIVRFESFSRNRLKSIPMKKIVYIFQQKTTKTIFGSDRVFEI